MSNLVLRMAPTQDFTATPKAGRTTIAVYLGASDGATVTAHSPINDEDVTFKIPGQYLEVMTDEAIAGADAGDYVAVYFYPEEG